MADAEYTINAPADPCRAWVAQQTGRGWDDPVVAQLTAALPALVEALGAALADPHGATVQAVCKRGAVGHVGLVRETFYYSGRAAP